MGQYKNVSLNFLLQTLEKNLMSNLNKVKSFNERAKGENFNQEFSSGRKFEADKAVRGEVEDDNNVISRGACGAFIHGLEDEYRQVLLLKSGLENRAKFQTMIGYVLQNFVFIQTMLESNSSTTDKNVGYNVDYICWLHI